MSQRLARAWVRQAGALPARLEITRADAFASTFSYGLRDASGVLVESGRVEIDSLVRPAPAIDLIPDGGTLRRLGRYSIADDVLQLDYGAPGAPRPAGLTGASISSTSR